MNEIPIITFYIMIVLILVDIWRKSSTITPSPGVGEHFLKHSREYPSYKRDIDGKTLGYPYTFLLLVSMYKR